MLNVLISGFLGSCISLFEQALLFQLGKLCGPSPPLASLTASFGKPFLLVSSLNKYTTNAITSRTYRGNLPEKLMEFVLYLELFKHQKLRTLRHFWLKTQFILKIFFFLSAFVQSFW